MREKKKVSFWVGILVSFISLIISSGCFVITFTLKNNQTALMWSLIPLHVLQFVSLIYVYFVTVILKKEKSKSYYFMLIVLIFIALVFLSLIIVESMVLTSNNLN